MKKFQGFSGGLVLAWEGDGIGRTNRILHVGKVDQREGRISLAEMAPIVVLAPILQLFPGVGKGQKPMHVLL